MEDDVQKKQLGHVEREVLHSLVPMFPQLSARVIRRTILKPANQVEPYDEFMLLQRCIDDLLVLVSSDSDLDSGDNMWPPAKAAPRPVSEKSPPRWRDNSTISISDDSVMSPYRQGASTSGSIVVEGMVGKLPDDVVVTYSNDGDDDVVYLGSGSGCGSALATPAVDDQQSHVAANTLLDNDEPNRNFGAWRPGDSGRIMDHVRPTAPRLWNRAWSDTMSVEHNSDPVNVSSKLASNVNHGGSAQWTNGLDLWPSPPTSTTTGAGTGVHNPTPWAVGPVPSTSKDNISVFSMSQTNAPDWTMDTGTGGAGPSWRAPDCEGNPPGMMYRPWVPANQTPTNSTALPTFSTSLNNGSGGAVDLTMGGLASKAFAGTDHDDMLKDLEVWSDMDMTDDMLLNMPGNPWDTIPMSNGRKRKRPSGSSAVSMDVHVGDRALTPPAKSRPATPEDDIPMMQRKARRRFKSNPETPPVQVREETVALTAEPAENTAPVAAAARPAPVIPAIPAKPAAAGRLDPPPAAARLDPPPAAARLNPPDNGAALTPPAAAARLAPPPTAAARLAPPVAAARATPSEATGAGKLEPTFADRLAARDAEIAAIVAKRTTLAAARQAPPAAAAIPAPPPAAVARPAPAAAAARPAPPAAAARPAPPAAAARPATPAAAARPATPAVAARPAPPAAAARPAPPAAAARPAAPAAATRPAPPAAAARPATPAVAARPATPAAAARPATPAVAARPAPPAAAARPAPPAAAARPPLPDNLNLPLPADPRPAPAPVQLPPPPPPPAHMHPPADLGVGPGHNGFNGEPVAARPEVPDGIEANAQKVISMFPDVDPTYVREQLAATNHFDPVNVLCNNLLENPAYPKKQAAERAARPQSPKEKECCSKDLYNDYTDQVSWECKDQCLILLQNEFRRVSVKDLRVLAKAYNWHYAPIRKCVLEGLKANNITLEEQYPDQKMMNSSMDSSRLDSPGYFCPTMVMNASRDLEPFSIKYIPRPGMGEASYKMKLLKNGRQKMMLRCKMLPELRQEVEFVLASIKSRTEEADHSLAMSLNETAYEAEGQTIECGCCFGDFTFESMVQCYEGHLFCRDCLKNYAKEAVYGQGKSKLQCMTDGCDAVYPREQMEAALPQEMLSKYEDRLKEEALNMADMEDLVRCPSCEFAAIMDPGDKVFSCQNTDCMKETCRYCKEDWKDHFGIPCKELEKKDETKLRLEFEEKMTEAKMRKCHKCKAMFYKSDGCNRMTCRCGATMCYICREPSITYMHFCRHVREPGHACDKCKDCSLWTNPEEDDERAVKEIRKEAADLRKAQGFTEEKLIGAPDEGPAPKKAKVANPPALGNPAAIPAALLIEAVRNAQADAGAAFANAVHVANRQQAANRPNV